jgi:hypothetical protein
MHRHHKATATTGKPLGAYPRDATGNQRRHRLRPQTRLGSPSSGAPGGGTGATHTQHKATATTGRHLAGNPWARTCRQLQE